MPLQELEHTSATLAALDSLEGTLKDAHGAYGGQRHKIKQSHALLSKMQRASLVDRLTLYGGAGRQPCIAWLALICGCMHAAQIIQSLPVVVNCMQTTIEY